MRKFMFLGIVLLTACSTQNNESRMWLAGDHHIHSHYSVGWDSANPPKPVVGGDATYSIIKNAQMAEQHGLQWMVATDHGGPNHSKINLQEAYPELLEARKTHPDVVQFVGL